MEVRHDVYYFIAKVYNNLEAVELVNVEERHNAYYFISELNHNLEVAELLTEEDNLTVNYFTITLLSRISRMKTDRSK